MAESPPLRIVFALPGLHRVPRGAEVVFETVADHLARADRHEVTLIGMGEPRPDRAYRYRRVGGVARTRFERWPAIPFLRHEFMYEELTFASALMAGGLPEADVTVTCSYPWLSWALRRARDGRGGRARHVFVTQNGDWPVLREGPEPRFFGCDGLVCTNPVYFERHRDRWPAALIPNGMDPDRFRPGPGDRAGFDLPADRPVVLMASALDPSKRVLEAIRAVARVPDVFLVIAGDGPLRNEVDALAADLLPGRFRRGAFPFDRMPDLYRSADLFLHARILEPFGNVYVEALASGLPVVAHDDPVSRWILGEHGTLVDTSSTDAWATAIATALANRSDGEAAAASARARFDWASVSRRYADFFEKVASA